MDWREGRGKRIGQECWDSVPESAKVRPLRDAIVIEPLEWKPSQVVAVAYFGKPLRGLVKAVGPGTYPKRYNGPKGKRTKVWDSRAFLPTEVKVGDIVELGGLELGGYLFQTFRWGEKEHVICREADVTGIVDES
jgi:co-chaperonin GroES (HSP10)